MCSQRREAPSFLINEIHETGAESWARQEQEKQNRGLHHEGSYTGDYQQGPACPGPGGRWLPQQHLPRQMLWSFQTEVHVGPPGQSEPKPSRKRIKALDNDWFETEERDKYHCTAALSTVLTGKAYSSQSRVSPKTAIKKARGEHEQAGTESTAGRGFRDEHPPRHAAWTPLRS